MRPSAALLSHLGAGSIYLHIPGPYGHARNQGGRQPAAAKPFLYTINRTSTMYSEQQAEVETYR